MSQTKLQSLREALTNVIIGYIIAVISNMFVLSLFGYQTSLSKSMGIGLCFTIISIIRNYIVRRFFNNKEKTHGKHKHTCSCKTTKSTR